MFWWEMPRSCECKLKRCLSAKLSLISDISNIYIVLLSSLVIVLCIFPHLWVSQQRNGFFTFVCNFWQLSVMHLALVSVYLPAVFTGTHPQTPNWLTPPLYVMLVGNCLVVWARATIELLKWFEKCVGKLAVSCAIYGSYLAICTM